MIDFSATADQDAFAEAVTAALRVDVAPGATDASPETWRDLAELGALGLLTDDGGGDLRDLVALMTALGAAGCPGSVVATVAAAAHLTDDERGDLAAGRLRASLLVGECVPWLETSNVVFELDGADLWRVACEAKGAVPTLSREPWTLVGSRRDRRVADGGRFAIAAELGLAAALLGMAGSLLQRAADHARTRIQFGRPIGSFQGVAHPLADSWAQMTAASELVRLVATEATLGSASVDRSRLARAEAADASLVTAYRVHQAMGGLSFAEETGIGAISTRIRQWSLLLPDG